MTDSTLQEQRQLWVTRGLLLLALARIAGWMGRFWIGLVSPGQNSLRTNILLVLTLVVWLAALYAVFRPELKQIVASRSVRRKLIFLIAGILLIVAAYGSGFVILPDSLIAEWNSLFAALAPLALLTCIALSWDALRMIVGRPESWLVVVSIAASLVVAEGLARFYVRSILKDENLRALYELDNGEEVTTSRFLPHHYSLYRLNPEWQGRGGQDRINALGTRGAEVVIPKPAGVFRIVAIGGSTTYSTSVDRWQDSYPAQLETVLREDYGYGNVEVINGGVGGYDSWETLINFETRLLEVEPDLVIVYQNINDIDTRLVPPDQYQADNSGLRQIFDTRKVLEANTWPNRVPSVLWRYLGINLRWFEVRRSLGLNDLVEKPCTGTDATEACLGMTPEEALAANPPIYYERNIRSIVGVAAAHQADVLLLTFIVVPFEEDYMSRPEYQAALAEHNDVMRKLGDELDVYFYDFAQDMPANPEYYTDGRHMTVEGNRIRAELIARFLHQSAAIPSP